MNLAELIDTIEDTTENEFTFEQHVDFITQAEKTIYNTVKFPALTKQQVSNTATSNDYVTNTDYLYTKSLAVTVSDVNYTLLQKDYSFIEEAYPSTSDSGTPKYYAILGLDNDNKTQIVFAPAPAGEYATIHTYAAYPDSITKDATAKDDAKTSWLGDNFDNVLLNGALVEAARFMKADPDIMQNYNEMYLSSLKIAEQLRESVYTDGYRQ